jgi:hypothetical protein
MPVCCMEHLGIGFVWLAFIHFIERGLFDWKRSSSNANSNTRTSHETSIKLMIRPPVFRKLYFNIVMC